MLPWQRQIRQLNYQKTDVCVVNLLCAIFGEQRIKGFRAKGEWSTGIKYCVQSPEIPLVEEIKLACLLETDFFIGIGCCSFPFVLVNFSVFSLPTRAR